MRVRIYDCDDQGNETLRCEADLVDVFPDDWDRDRATESLAKYGRVWCGGGSAPLVLLTRVVP